MTIEFICQHCHQSCIIDGDYPKFFCYCDTCHNYAEGFDATEYAADYMGAQMDHAVDMMEVRRKYE